MPSIQPWTASSPPRWSRPTATGRRSAISATRSGDRTAAEPITTRATPAADAFVVTDISRDGTLAGPDVAGLAEVSAATSVPVVASGGVGTLDDLRALAAVPRLAGVIVGKALYEGRFDVGAGLAALAGVRS